eukprot:198915_1
MDEIESPERKSKEFYGSEDGSPALEELMAINGKCDEIHSNLMAEVFEFYQSQFAPAEHDELTPCETLPDVGRIPNSHSGDLLNLSKSPHVMDTPMLNTLSWRMKSSNLMHSPAMSPLGSPMTRALYKTPAFESAPRGSPSPLFSSQRESTPGLTMMSLCENFHTDVPSDVTMNAETPTREFPDNIIKTEHAHLSHGPFSPTSTPFLTPNSRSPESKPHTGHTPIFKQLSSELLSIMQPQKKLSNLENIHAPNGPFSDISNYLADHSEVPVHSAIPHFPLEPPDPSSGDSPHADKSSNIKSEAPQQPSLEPDSDVKMDPVSQIHIKTENQESDFSQLPSISQITPPPILPESEDSDGTHIQSPPFPSPPFTTEFHLALADCIEHYSGNPIKDGAVFDVIGDLLDFLSRQHAQLYKGEPYDSPDVADTGASECSSTETSLLSDNSPISLSKHAIPSLHFGDLAGVRGPRLHTRITVPVVMKSEFEEERMPFDYQIATIISKTYKVCQAAGYGYLRLPERVLPQLRSPRKRIHKRLRGPYNKSAKAHHAKYNPVKLESNLQVDLSDLGGPGPGGPTYGYSSGSKGSSPPDLPPPLPTEIGGKTPPKGVGGRRGGRSRIAVSRPPPSRRPIRIPPHAVAPRNIRGRRGGLVRTLSGNSKLRVREGSMLSSWMETQMVPWMPEKRGRSGKSMGRSTSINSGYRPLSGPSRTSSNTILSSMSHHNGHQTRKSTSSGRYNIQRPMVTTHSQLQSGGPGAIRVQSHPARSQIIHSQSPPPPAPPYNQMTEPSNSRRKIKQEETSQDFFGIPRRLRCEICDQEFQLKDHLIQHVIEVHQMSIDNVKSEEPPISRHTSLTDILRRSANSQHVTESHQIPIDAVLSEEPSISRHTSLTDILRRSANSQHVTESHQIPIDAVLSEEPSISRHTSLTDIIRRSANSHIIRRGANRQHVTKSHQLPIVAGQSVESSISRHTSLTDTIRRGASNHIPIVTGQSDDPAISRHISLTDIRRGASNHLTRHASESHHMPLSIGTVKPAEPSISRHTSLTDNIRRGTNRQHVTEAHQIPIVTGQSEDPAISRHTSLTDIRRGASNHLTRHASESHHMPLSIGTVKPAEPSISRHTSLTD